MKKLVFISLAFLFALTGCQNDEELADGLSSEEAKAVLDESTTSLSNDIISLAESEGINELLHISELIEEYSIIGGRVSQKAWTKARLNNIIQQFVDGPAGRMGMSTPTSLEEIKGLFVWNSERGEFEVSESEFFIVQFPTEGSETNNAEFIISALEYVTIDGGDWIITTPTHINASLKVDGVTLVELIYNVSWTENGTPEVADVSLLISPFTFVINFKDTFSKSTSLLSSLAINDELIVSIDVDVAYETESKLDPYLIEGNVQYRRLRIEGNVNAKEIGIDGNPNDFINLELYADNSKLGDVIFIQEEDADGYQDYVPYVLFLDGSQEKLEDILAPVFEEIEVLLAEFE